MEKNQCPACGLNTQAGHLGQRPEGGTYQAGVNGTKGGWQGQACSAWHGILIVLEELGDLWRVVSCGEMIEFAV